MKSTSALYSLSQSGLLSEAVLLHPGLTVFSGSWVSGESQRWRLHTIGCCLSLQETLKDAEVTSTLIATSCADLKVTSTPSWWPRFKSVFQHFKVKNQRIKNFKGDLVTISSAVVVVHLTSTWAQHCVGKLDLMKHLGFCRNVLFWYLLDGLVVYMQLQKLEFAESLKLTAMTLYCHLLCFTSCSYC